MPARLVRSLAGPLAAAASGLALALAFPSAALAELAWVALVPLLWAIAGERPRRALALGWLAGFVFYAATLDWIPGTITSGTSLPRAVAIVALALLAATLGFSVAAFAAAVRFFEMRRRQSVIWIAVPLWTAIEWLRVEGLRFPWNLLGATQGESLRLAQMVEVTGVYGLGALVIAVNVAVFELLFRPRGRRGAARFRLATVLALGLALDAFGALRLREVAENPGEHRLRVGLVQPSIDPLVKWDPESRQEIMARQQELSRAIAPSAELIVWPEASAPFVFASDAFYDEYPERFAEDRRLRDGMIAFARSLGRPLVFGAPALEVEAVGRGEVWRPLNRVFLMSPEGRVEAQYDKTILVPFGEYVPWRKVLWFVRRLVPAVGDFVPGGEIVPFVTREGALAPLVCWEATFPDFVRRFADRGAGVLVNLTNDAWFGTSAALSQHLALARLRAVENRAPLVRVANSGISAVVGADGRFLAQIAPGERAARVVEIRWSDRTTFYSRHGDVFAAGMTLAAAALLVYAAWIPPASDAAAVRVG